MGAQESQLLGKGSKHKRIFKILFLVLGNWLLTSLQHRGQQLHHKQLERFFIMQIFEKESQEKTIYQQNKQGERLEKVNLNKPFFLENFIFSDDSKFNAFRQDGKTIVWRKPITVAQIKNLKPTVKPDSAGAARDVLPIMLI